MIRINSFFFLVYGCLFCYLKKKFLISANDNSNFKVLLNARIDTTYQLFILIKDFIKNRKD